MNKSEKKAKIYFVRHGQTQNNLNNNMNTGDDNDPLTDLWIEQAISAWKSLKNSWIIIDLIISSNLDRAIDTGKYIWKEINYNWDYHVDVRLREQDGWVFKWKNRDLIKEEYDIQNNYDFRKIFRDKQFNKIESAEEFDARVTQSLVDIQREYKWKNVLIVWHSGTSRPLLRNIQWLDFDFAYYKMSWLKNAQIIELEKHIIEK